MSLIINILTWNISWGCMTSNQNSFQDQTAQALSTHCYQLARRYRQPICLQNVCNLIDQEKVKHDLIAFQESTNWRKLIQNSHRLSKMKYVHSQSYSSEIISFYNPLKFELKGVSYGEIESGRPCHLLLLSILKNKHQLIFINVHNSKGYSDSDLETGLSKLITSQIKSQFHTSTRPISIIVAGDFNDHGHSNYWEKIYPFRYSQTILRKRVVSSKGKKPPLSCCIGRKSLKQCSLPNYLLFGDYILVSSDFRIIHNNHTHPDFNFDCQKYPTSDHLPISSTIVLNINTNKKSQRKVKKKKKK